MKRWYHLAIAAAVLIALLTYLNYDIKNDQTKQAAEEKAAKVIAADYPWKSLQEFTIANNLGSVTFAPVSKSDGTNSNTQPEEWHWQIVKPLVTDAENSDIQNYLNTLKDLKTISTVEENAEDLSIFGLEEKNQPMRISLSGSDGKSFEFLVGTLNPTSSGNYMRLPDSRQVKLIEQKLNFLATKRLNFYRAKTFFVFDNKDVSQINYRWQSDPEIILEKKENRWKIIEPIQAHADNNLTHAFLGDLKGLKIDDYVSEDITKEAGKYGFQKPRAKIKIYLPNYQNPTTPDQAKPTIGKNLHLTIGGDTPGKDGFYVGRNDSSTVYKLQSFQLEKTKRNLSYFVDKDLGNFVPGEINSIKLVHGTQAPQELELQKDELWAIRQGDRLYLADYAKVETLLRKASDLQAKAFLSTKVEKRFGLDAPTFQLILSAPAQADQPAPVYRTIFKKSPSAIYAQGGSDNFVFEIEPSIYQGLLEGLEQLRPSQVISDSPKQKIEQFTITIGEGSQKRLVIRRQEDRWMLEATPKDLIPASTLAENIVNQIYGLTIDKTFAPNSGTVAWEKTAEKDLTIVFGDTKGNDGKVMLAFKPVANQKYYLNVSDRGPYSGYEAHIHKPAVEQLFRSLGLLAEESAKPQEESK